jgi:hypothetical protein
MDQEEQEEWMTPSNKLEWIEEQGDTCLFTNTILLHPDTLGERLKTLVLKASPSNNGEIPCTKTLALLKNLPVLNSLTVEGYPFTLSDCELILQCKVLSCVSLSNITIMKDDQVVDTIQPATSITSLSVDMHGRTDRFNGWAFRYSGWNTYICKKFTHLTELHYRLVDPFYASYENIMAESPYAILFKTFPLELKSFRIDCKRSPFPTIKLLDTFGCQLTSLELNVHFESKGEHVFNILADSDQCQYIGKLKIMGVPQVFDGLEDLIHLKILHICGSETQSYHTIPFMDLNSLLMHCPESLQSIAIHDCDMLFDTDAAIHQFQYAYITTLTLKNVYLAEYFDTFILTCLPRLVSLSLVETNDIRILNLPNRHFHHVEITSSNTGHISVTLKHDRRPRFYCTKGMSRFGFSVLGDEIAPVHKRLEDVMDHVDGWIDLICGQIDYFVINGVSVLLGFS